MTKPGRHQVQVWRDQLHGHAAKLPGVLGAGSGLQHHHNRQSSPSKEDHVTSEEDRDLQPGSSSGVGRHLPQLAVCHQTPDHIPKTQRQGRRRGQWTRAPRPPGMATNFLLAFGKIEDNSIFLLFFYLSLPKCFSKMRATAIAFLHNSRKDRDRKGRSTVVWNDSLVFFLFFS